MKALVTGGAGYIGSHLVDRLISTGFEVSVLDDLSTGKLSNLAHLEGRIEFHKDTILNQAMVSSLVREVDVVYHLAAAVGVGNIIAKPLESIITNARGTDVVLEACAHHGTKVVVASTSEIYGKTSKMPMSEEDDRVLGSTSVSRWSYSTAKALDEHLALEYSRTGLPVSVVRYFNSFGPRIDFKGYGSVVANFIRQALSNEPITVHGDGHQTRCFTYIADTVEGTFLAGSVKAAEGSVFNVGNDVEITINELAERVKVACGSTSEITHVSHESRYGKAFEDTKRRVPDLTRSRNVLGYSPTVSLEEGLRLTLDWWRREHR
ncbi:MAG: GDP-mannose 4,6-dehydratase [Ilumatobacteraceae bacterium]